VKLGFVWAQKSELYSLCIDRGGSRSVRSIKPAEIQEMKCGPHESHWKGPGVPPPPFAPVSQPTGRWRGRTDNWATTGVSWGLPVFPQWNGRRGSLDWGVGAVRIGRGALPVAHASCIVTKGRRGPRFYIDAVNGPGAAALERRRPGPGGTD